MATLNLSEKLSKYLNRVESETGRRIEFQKAPNVGLHGMSFAFKLHPTNIEVVVTKDIDLGNPIHEHSIAHEVTHGYVIYKLGYCQPKLKRRTLGSEINHARLVFTMIDDIVVNKIIQDAGFSPFAPPYLGMVEKETKAAQTAKEDFYDMYADDPLFKDRFMVFRYILAWGFVNYYDLEPYARRTIKKFLKAFQRGFPRHYAMANQIKESILQNDIFSREGHRRVLDTILRLWHLDDLVELSIT